MARGSMTRLKDFLSKHEELVRRSFLLAVLLALPAIGVLRSKVNLEDADIWWHLRTGEWILSHHMLPLTDPFSLHGAGKEWVAYSWLFEVLVFRLQQWFGLSGILYYNVVLSIAITAAVFTLIKRFEPAFISVVGLAAISIVSMLPVLLAPRPWLFTVLFFTIELKLLLGARATGNNRALWYLPFLFALWANLHIQFVYGLLLLGVAAAESFVTKILHKFTDQVEESAFHPARMALVTLACIAATLANPYHYKIYFPVLDYMVQQGFYDLVSELQAPQFRTLCEWLMLGIAVGTSFILGRRRTINAFFVLLLLMAVTLSFRSRRDMWLVAVAAAGIVAASSSNFSVASQYVLSRARILSLSVAMLVVIAFTMRTTDLSEDALRRKVSEKLPAEAVAVVEERGYAGPLYNHFNWGGYLIWRLPGLPVAMDGRTNIYGVEKASHSLEIWSGGSTWSSDPELDAAGLVVAQIDQPLTSLLKRDPRFDLVYEDKIAAVFVAHNRQKVELWGRTPDS